MTKVSRQRRSLQTNAAKQRHPKQILLGRSQSYNSEDDFEIISVKKKQSGSQISPKDTAHNKKEVVKNVTKSSNTTSSQNTFAPESKRRTAGRLENISASTSSVGRQKKITERMKIKETKMSPEDITVIDSSSENSSPEAKTKKIGETRRASTEQKKGKSYLGMEYDPEFAPKNPEDSSEERNMDIYQYVPSQDSSKPSHSQHVQKKSNEKKWLLDSPNRRSEIFQKYPAKTNPKITGRFPKRHSLGSSLSSDNKKKAVTKNVTKSSNTTSGQKTLTFPRNMFEKLKIPDLSHLKTASVEKPHRSKTSDATNIAAIEIASSSSDQEKSSNDLLRVPPTKNYGVKRKVDCRKKHDKNKRSKLNSGGSRHRKAVPKTGIGNEITDWTSSDPECEPVIPSPPRNVVVKEKAQVIILSDSDQKEADNEQKPTSKPLSQKRGANSSKQMSSSLEKETVGSTLEESKSNKELPSSVDKERNVVDNLHNSNENRNVFENLFGSASSGPDVEKSTQQTERRNSFVSLSSFSDSSEAAFLSAEATSERPSSPVFGHRATDNVVSNRSKETNDDKTKKSFECERDTLLTINPEFKISNECDNQSNRPREARSGSSTPVYKDRASVFDQLNTEFLKIKSNSTATSEDEMPPCDQDTSRKKSSLSGTAKLMMVKKLLSPKTKRKVKATQFKNHKLKLNKAHGIGSEKEPKSLSKKSSSTSKPRSENKDRGDEKRENVRKRSLASKFEELVTGRQDKCQSVTLGVSEGTEHKTATDMTDIPRINDDHNFFSGSPRGPSIRDVKSTTVGKRSIKSVKRKLHKKNSNSGDNIINSYTSTESETDPIKRPLKRPKKKASLDSNSTREKLERKRAMPRRYNEYVPSGAQLEDLYEKEAEHLSQTFIETTELKPGAVISKRASSQSTLTSLGDVSTSGTESSMKESSESDVDTPSGVVAPEKLKASHMLTSSDDPLGAPPQGPLGTPPRTLDSDESDDEGLFNLLDSVELITFSQLRIIAAAARITESST